jgi:hypothetical protein
MALYVASVLHVIAGNIGEPLEMNGNMLQFQGIRCNMDLTAKSLKRLVAEEGLEPPTRGL